MHFRDYTKLLIVDSDDESYKRKSSILEARRFDCHRASDARAALGSLRSQRFDLILSAMFLSDQDATTLCHTVRREFMVPIMVYGPASDSLNEVACLEAGAEDFLDESVDDSVLIARVRTRLRTHRNLRSTHVAPRGRGVGDIILDQDRIQAFHQGEPLGLTPTEMKLLRLLSARPNFAVSREKILSQVWDTSYLGDKRVVDNHIRNLRRKLEDAGSEVVIQSVRGVGYRLASSGGARRRVQTPA